jgi:integrase
VDAFKSIHPVPAAWLRDSDLAAFAPAYVRRLMVRHSTAMGLLQAGTNATEIALWLGHESPSTTHMYVEADLAMKERTLARLKPPAVKPTRYRPPKGLMQFLQSL